MFYDLLKNICTEKGIRITSLVLSCGGSKGMLSGWKKGASPNMDILLKLADYLDCSVDYLLGRTSGASLSVAQARNGNVNGNISNSTLSIADNSELSEYEADIIRVFRSLTPKKKTQVMSYIYDLEE